ncbi:MAG: 1-deoxy-D-xylulose-5-phosphate reductoisomerase [Candidatus Omnitrophota bacterium]
MRRIAILGSTGSIGISTLDVVRKNPSAFKAVALSTNSNTVVLGRQIREFRPLAACISGNGQVKAFKAATKIFSGSDGLLRIAADRRVDRVVLAISGAAALPPLLAAIEHGKDVALANKESLAMAGTIVMRKAAQNKVKILPIDSEQSAIWQCLQGQQKKSVKNIYLTASGGPFRSLQEKYFKDITPKQALAHPRWKMGKKITVDSATLMNKGLELFEAMYLFGIAPEKIKVVVHPESIVHSMVEFVDGSVIAQLSVTDMRIPIQYALSYPERLAAAGNQLDLCKLKQLNFEKPDFGKFPCLKLAYRAAYNGGTAPCALNAANEVSVAEFLQGRIKFTSIPLVIEKVLDKLNNIRSPRLDEVLDADAWARRQASEVIRKSC